MGTILEDENTGLRSMTASVVVWSVTRARRIASRYLINTLSARLMRPGRYLTAHRFLSWTVKDGIPSLAAEKKSGYVILVSLIPTSHHRMTRGASQGHEPN